MALRAAGYVQVNSSEDEVAVWGGDDALIVERWPADAGACLRLLDCYYLLFGLGSRDVVFAAFCEMVAPSYEAIVDSARNMENLSQLRDELLIHGLSPGVVIDFGCGTGLALPVWSDQRNSLLGFDQSPTMREIASGRGLTVLSPHDLVIDAWGPFVGGFASYVFHMECHAELLAEALTRVADGGFFAANYHKGIGREWAERILATAGFELVAQRASRHGPQITYRRGAGA